MSDSVVAQTWPIANGLVELNVWHREPNAEAIALLVAVIAAIEAYQAAVMELYLQVRCCDHPGLDHGFHSHDCGAGD